MIRGTRAGRPLPRPSRRARPANALAGVPASPTVGQPPAPSLPASQPPSLPAPASQPPRAITARSGSPAMMMDTCAPSGVPNYPPSSGPGPGPLITARYGWPTIIVGTCAASGPPNCPRSSASRITARSAQRAAVRRLTPGRRHELPAAPSMITKEKCSIRTLFFRDHGIPVRRIACSRPGRHIRSTSHRGRGLD
jgi:hypothetical protein